MLRLRHAWGNAACRQKLVSDPDVVDAIFDGDVDAVVDSIFDEVSDAVVGVEVIVVSVGVSAVVDELEDDVKGQSSARMQCSTSAPAALTPTDKLWQTVKSMELSPIAIVHAEKSAPTPTPVSA